jgi:hypothetical protein
MKATMQDWHNAADTEHTRRWRCWRCDREVGGQRGYYAITEVNHNLMRSELILLCPYCGAPTYFPDTERDEQIPKPLLGNSIEHLPDNLEHVYNEMRRCIGASAYTAAVLIARKLLIHIAVDNGAPEEAPKGKGGIEFYVDYLCDNHYVPPGGKKWVDRIRSQGNDASHKIIIMNEDDALLLLKFLELILRANYEFPASLPQTPDTEETKKRLAKVDSFVKATHPD